MDNKMNALDRPIDHNGRDPFYLGASLFSLVIVLVGFSPSFYLQEVFELPESSVPPCLRVSDAPARAWPGCAR